MHVLKGAELTDVRVGIDDGKVLSTHPMQHRHTAKAKAARHEQEEQPAGYQRLKTFRAAVRTASGAPNAAGAVLTTLRTTFGVSRA